MKRLLAILLFLAFAAIGLVFAQLNPHPVAVDFHFFQIALPVAVVVPALLASGALVGGLLVFVLNTLPLKARLARATRSSAPATKTSESASSLALSVDRDRA